MTERMRLAACAATLGVISGTMFVHVTPALADEQPPSYEAPELPEIDPNSSGLLLGDGATLAEPRVLSIRAVTEDAGTGEATDPSPSGPSPTDDGQTPYDGGGGEQREERSSGQHKFTLQTDVLFEEGSGELSDDARSALTEVAAAIDEHQPTQVSIFGFTDDQGSYESGRDLSQARAENTHAELLELIENPTPIAFNVRGYSEDFPLYDNSTEEGRQRNRRVEISWPTDE